MGRLTLSSFQRSSATTVSNIFLDNYMGDANGEFVKVYLYLLRCMGGSQASAGISLSDIGDRLNLTEKDIIRALRYWNKTGVLNVVFDAATGAPSSIAILSLEADSDSAASMDCASSDPDSLCSEAPAQAEIPQAAAPAKDDGEKHPAPVSYSSAQLKRLKEQEDIKQLLYIVEKYIGKPLSTADINTVLYFQESLGFLPELIEYLVEYCVSNQHPTLRYMEKVALSWYDQGIRTVEAAKNSSVMYTRRNLPVIKAFGLSDRRLTPVELDFIGRWYDEYGFDSEIIKEACQRTVLALGKPNFSYTDGILRKWKSAGIHTKDDLQKLDSGFRAKLTVPAGSRPQPSPAKTNRFNNFSQRTYDFDAIEKELISNNK